jgi:hypothetical protein
LINLEGNLPMSDNGTENPLNFALVIPATEVDISAAWAQLFIKIADRLLGNTAPPGTEINARWEDGGWQIRCVQHINEPIILQGLQMEELAVLASEVG